MSRTKNPNIREAVPVYVDNVFVRHVTEQQTPREVAGKVLKPRMGWRRTATKVTIKGVPAWSCHYREMTKEEIAGGMQS